MSAKVTLIRAVITIHGKTKKPVTLHDVYNEINCTDTRLSTRLYSYEKDGFLKKSKAGNSNAYIPTAKGRKLISATPPELFWQDKDWDAWVNGDPDLNANSSIPKARVGRLSSEAITAIDSISEIIQRNDQLANTLISIQSQINFVLNQSKQNDGEGSADE